jgi:hypothetical protein
MDDSWFAGKVLPGRRQGDEVTRIRPPEAMGQIDGPGGSQGQSVTTPLPCWGSEPAIQDVAKRDLGQGSSAFATHNQALNPASRRFSSTKLTVRKPV